MFLNAAMGSLSQFESKRICMFRFPCYADYSQLKIIKSCVISPTPIRTTKLPSSNLIVINRALRSGDVVVALIATMLLIGTWGHVLVLIKSSDLFCRSTNKL